MLEFFSGRLALGVSFENTASRPADSSEVLLPSVQGGKEGALSTPKVTLAFKGGAVAVMRAEMEARAHGGKKIMRVSLFSSFSLFSFSFFFFI